VRYLQRPGGLRLSVSPATVATRDRSSSHLHESSVLRGSFSPSTPNERVRACMCACVHVCVCRPRLQRFTHPRLLHSIGVRHSHSRSLHSIAGVRCDCVSSTPRSAHLAVQSANNGRHCSCSRVPLRCAHSIMTRRHVTSLFFFSFCRNLLQAHFKSRGHASLRFSCAQQSVPCNVSHTQYTGFTYQVLVYNTKKTCVLAAKLDTRG
jgi:hypothetical protein